MPCSEPPSGNDSLSSCVLQQSAPSGSAPASQVKVTLFLGGSACQWLNKMVVQRSSGFPSMRDFSSTPSLWRRSSWGQSTWSSLRPFDCSACPALLPLLFLGRSSLPVNLLYTHLFLENLGYNSGSLPLVPRVCQIPLQDVVSSEKVSQDPAPVPVILIFLAGNGGKYLWLFPREERCKGKHKWCVQNLNNHHVKKTKNGYKSPDLGSMLEFFSFFFSFFFLSLKRKNN